MFPSFLQDVRARLDELFRTSVADARRHPGAVRAVIASSAIVVVLSLVGGLWFFASLRRGLPDNEAVGRIGEMDEATTVYDRSDSLAFTIFKEQRIEEPLSAISPNLI